MMTLNEIVRLKACEVVQGHLRLKVTMARHLEVEMWKLVSKRLDHNWRDMMPIVDMHPNMLDECEDRESDETKKVGC